MRLDKKSGSHTQPVLSIVWFFFKPYKLRALILFILSLLIGGLEAATIAAIYPILSVTLNAGAGQGNVILSLFTTTVDLLPIEDEFIAYCVLFLLITLLMFVAKLTSLRFKVKFDMSVVRENQTDVFKKFVGADYQYFIDHKQGELIYNITVAPDRVSVLIGATTDLISQVILLISVIIILTSLSWQGTVAVLLLGLGYHYLTRYLGKQISYHSGKGEMEAARESDVILNEAISGIKQVKVFVAGESWIDRFSGTIKERWYHAIRGNVWQQIPPLTLTLILYLSVGIVAVLIRIMAPASFTELIPLLGTFTFALFRLIPIMASMGSLRMSFMRALPDCEVVYSIRNNTITHIKDGQKELSSFKSDMKFDNVSFAYKGRAKTVKDISVTFQKGKTTAIVGRSGAGKTTIINLLLRLFEPDKGEIKIDGLDLKEYKLSSWLSKVGFVSQDIFILNDTVANNITFRSDKYSREEVVKAAKCADAHSFITELPNGYDTFVGDKGMRLSGGQAQRIAVARAMIREPQILIFDEATNNLDNISEAIVQNAIDELSKDHTVIIIAHRLSTIINADKILVFEDGRVVEEGTHKELMENRGTYWELYQSRLM